MTTRNASTQAVQPAAADTLLVIGAGEGHDIPPDWQEHYRRLVLVEPLPELARSLRRAFGEHPNVEVLETAIVPDVSAGDTVTLYEFNWAPASSRHQPADLLQLFPGLKTERMRRVSALSPQQLIQEIALSPEKEHKLILEAPADEGPILAALIESHAYKNFSRIQLRYPVAGLYDTPDDPEAMLEALTACGFEIESQDRTDPDWPSISLIRNRWKIALEEARETIKALEAQLAEQAGALASAEQPAEARRVELQEQLSKAESAVNEKRPEENAATKKPSGDADIGDMLNDLKPFFSGRLITYVDVGAYVGAVFLKIHNSKTLKIREAHLYEPNPASFKTLKDNLKACNVSSLHACHFAVSSHTGEQGFIAAKSMTKTLGQHFEENQATGTFRAQSYTLDDLASTFTDGRIDLLKVDVEGAELDVLKGAEGLLRDQRIDVIYIEAGLNRQGTQQTYLGSIDMMLQDHGYRIFRIYEQKNEWMHDSPLLRRCNCVYMSASFANANPLKKTHEVTRLKQEISELKRQISMLDGHKTSG